MPYAQEQMGFKRPPKLFLRQDSENAQNPLGKTAFYDPQAESVTLYVTDRHPKDIMRSLSHELVHHTQNCNGKFDHEGEMGEGYAQNNPHLRGMEREAYEKGNLCFRDWEDGIKGTIYFEHLQKGVKTMSTKNWKNKELTTLLSEAWGFGFNLDTLNETGDKDTGASKGDKGKDEDDPEAKDYERGGDRKGDEDAKGEKDYESTKKGDKTKSGAKAYNKYPNKGDEKKGGGKAYSASLKEMGCPDSHGTEEDLGAEMAVMDTEEGESEDPSVIVDELGDLLARLQSALGGDEEDAEEDEFLGNRGDVYQEGDDEELEEVSSSSGRKSPHKDRRGDDERKRPMEEVQIRRLIRRSLKNIAERSKKKNG